MRQSSSTFSLLSFRIAAIALSTFSAAACIASPRFTTSEKPSAAVNMPANVTAATSPSEKPATASAATPASRSASAAARSTQNRHGCVFFVTLSSSTGLSKHWAIVPGRICSAVSNTAFAAGLAS